MLSDVVGLAFVGFCVAAIALGLWFIFHGPKR